MVCSLWSNRKICHELFCRLMNYGIKTLGYCAIMFLWCFSACSPARRINRIIQKHPEVLDSFSKTEIVVRNQQIYDTLLFFQNDTIKTEYVTILRTADTIRLITRERPCTTFVNTTEIRPTQIQERKVVRFLKDKKAKLIGAVYQGIIGLLLLALIFVILRKR